MSARVFYASGVNGRSIHVDSLGKALAKGFYVKFEGPSYRGGRHGVVGPFKTKAEANVRAFGKPRQPH